MRTSPPSLSITCIAMDNVRKILKNRRLSVNGLLTLIHSKHPDCGLPYSILRRLISYERKMTIDETILICDALDVPFTALFSFAGEFPHGQLKGMTAADIYHAIEQDDPVQLVISKCKNLRYAYRIAFQVLLDGLRGITDNYPSLEDLRITNPETLRSVFCIEAILPPCSPIPTFAHAAHGHQTHRMRRPSQMLSVRPEAVIRKRNENR